MKPSDLIETAGELVRLDQGKPKQANLKRAMSTACYALFHALFLNCADSLVGSAGADRSQRGWQQAYRAIEHSHARKQCTRNDMSRFSDDIQEFADKFVELQGKRHQADYDPLSRLTRNEVLIDIQTAEVAIDQLQGSTPRDRTAFAVWTVMKTRADPS